MTQDNLIHTLSLIGYWSSPTQPAEESRGWPDPRELTGAWAADDRRTTMEHLRHGKVFRTFAGTSSCRFCGRDLGSRELSDGVWAWPEGLDHYVEAHSVRLPEAFVGASRRSENIPSWLVSLDPELWLQSGESATPASAVNERTWSVDDSIWLEWAAASTPAHPASDAISLDEAKGLCRRLSHLTWSCELDEVMNRWLLQIRANDQTMKIYIQKCSALILERRLLSLRLPDMSRILPNEQSNSVAAEYDGTWGAARVLAVHPRAWLVWIKSPKQDWPTDDQIDKVLHTEQDFGWVTFHPNAGRSFIIPPCDEPTWRWLVSRERTAAEEVLKQETNVP